MSLKGIGLWHGSVAQTVIWINITLFLPPLVCFLPGSVIDSGDTAASDTILVLEALESSAGWKAHVLTHRNPDASGPGSPTSH